MNAPTYQLNSQLASQGDNHFNRITESGEYKGIFTLAKAITAKSGAQGIEFTFQSNAGAEANYLTLYTHNSQGQETYGLKQLNAMMMCMKVKQVTPQQETINEYDSNTNSKIPKQVNIYPDLMNAPIGLVLQKEEYEANDGSIKSKVNFYGFYNAETRQTANEMINKNNNPSALDAMISSLKDKTISTQQQKPAQPEPSFEDFDDDIPF